MIKVIVISDIKIYCEGLDKILSDTHPIRVVGAENNFLSATGPTGCKPLSLMWYCLI